METETRKLLNYIFFIIQFIVIIALIIEFVTDITINPRIHNQPDLVDTDLDLVSDVIGALIAAFHICFVGVQLRLLKNKA